ncbi:hypothetical protein F7725_005997 [Dissostichus mawsoni]|uniref:SH3 domain-containing protein n=1 Tax=Dissostichus mawsoni TaxID=36200 RepID=A0A7J5YST7_DISMA|nr:hypothetical protein F7725_005997 [Dissostichus mawsoni]
MPMFLTVYLSNNDQHFNEVPITPETLCRDVVELCKEPGEGECYLAEMWRGSEHIVGDGERMFEVLQKCGQQRGEVRYLLRHQRAPGRESGGSRAADQMMKRNQVKASVERCLENGISAPRLDMTLSDLQDLATQQQLQINAQQQLLASKQEQRLRHLKLTDQRQQQQETSEQDRLQQLRENAHNQEAKLRRVRAIRGQVEQKRLSNSKLVEEIEQMTGLFQQKQVELMVAVSRVEELSDQLDTLRSNRHEPPLPPPHHHTTSSAAELERLYKELQMRNKLNVDQSGRLQQQRDSLNKRNLEVAAMDRRLAELRQRLWKKKAALQQKENLPVPSDGGAPQHAVGSRVAAVGPYIQSSSSGSHGPRRRPGTRFRLIKSNQTPGLERLSEVRFSQIRGVSQGLTSRLLSPHGPITSLRTCSGTIRFSKMAAPPPIPIKPKPFSTSGPPTFSKPLYSTGTFPGKVRGGGGHLSSHSNTLPLPNKHEVAAVRPYTPDPSEALAPPLQKPQTLAASYIYSMYTTQGKGYQPGGGDAAQEPAQSVWETCPPSERGAAVSPLRHHELWVVFPRRRRDRHHGLHHAPRPLKKRSSITEPEGPAGPNIQKLLYQKTTLAAMETIPMETMGPGGLLVQPHEDGVEFMSKFDDNNQSESPEESLTPPPLPPRSPITPPEDREEEEEVCRSSSVHKEFPPYPPPPYPTCVEVDQGEDVTNMKPPEVMGQVPSPPHAGEVQPSGSAAGRSLEGEYDLVQRVIYDVEDPSMPNDEGITALHNAVCAGHTEIVKFLVQFGVCKFLVESGTAVFATTYSDMQTAADKCEEMEDGYAQCSQFLYGVQEKMGVMNRGVVYALWDYEAQSEDELGFSEGDCMTVLRRDEEAETDWWWARCGDHEGRGRGASPNARPTNPQKNQNVHKECRDELPKTQKIKQKLPVVIKNRLRL